MRLHNTEGYWSAHSTGVTIENLHTKIPESSKNQQRPNERGTDLKATQFRKDYQMHEVAMSGLVVIVSKYYSPT